MSELVGKDARIYVAGHRGLAGSAIVRNLTANGYRNLITRTHEDLDLIDQRAVREFLATVKPDFVFLAAAKVGGILANDNHPAEFIQQNLAIQSNVIHESWRNGVKRLLFLGSSCIYPKDSPQPIKEEYLLTGPLEKTNRAYAVAKIAGVEMCLSYNRQYGTDFLSVMPSNLYGPGDNYDLESSHVLPALLRKAHEAKCRGDKELIVWGSGEPRREFLHVDDMANACLFLMERRFQHAAESLHSGVINVGTGSDVTIRKLAEAIMDVVGFEGNLVFDRSKPDGVMRKLLDVTKLHRMGWKARIELTGGLRSTYATFRASMPSVPRNSQFPSVSDHA